MKKLWLAIFVCLCIAVPLTSYAATATLTFSWEQSVVTGLKEWRLYRSTSPNVAVVAANKVATIVYTGTQQPSYTSDQPMTAPDGAETTYYFVLTAVDTAGNESGKSNEVMALLDFKPPDSPATFTVTVVVTPTP